MEENYKSDIPEIRDSAILAFVSILETSHMEKIKSIIPEALSILVNMMNDDSVDVICTLAWFLEGISKFHFDCLSKFDLFEMLIKIIFENIDKNNKVGVYLCGTISTLAANLRPENSIEFSTRYMGPLLNKLLELVFINYAYDPRVNILPSVFAIGTIIQNAPDETLNTIELFYIKLYNAFELTLDAKNFINDNVRFEYQGYIAIAISAYVSIKTIDISQEEAEKLWILIKRSFEQRLCVYEEGLMLGSDLALAIGSLFSPMLTDFCCS